MKCPLKGRVVEVVMVEWDLFVFWVVWIQTVVTERAAEDSLRVFLFSISTCNFFPHPQQVGIVQACVVKHYHCIFTSLFTYFLCLCILYYLQLPTTLFCTVSLHFLLSYCLKWLLPLPCWTISSFSFFPTSIPFLSIPCTHFSTCINKSDILLKLLVTSVTTSVLV